MIFLDLIRLDFGIEPMKIKKKDFGFGFWFFSIFYFFSGLSLRQRSWTNPVEIQLKSKKIKKIEKNQIKKKIQLKSNWNRKKTQKKRKNRKKQKNKKNTKIKNKSKNIEKIKKSKMFYNLFGMIFRL